MIRSGRAAALGIASLALAGCDIDFVAVDTARAVARVYSEHADAFTADFTMHTAREATLTVVLEGRSVPGVENSRGGTTYEAGIVPDSLHPSIRLVVESGSGSGFEGYIPLVARRGPAEWSETTLRLPLARGSSAEESDDSAWMVVFRDSAGANLLELDSDSAPLPAPLLLDRGLVPEAAVEAEVLTRATFTFNLGPSTLRLLTTSYVEFPLP